MDTARCPSVRKHCGHHGNRRFRLPDKSRKPICLRRRLHKRTQPLQKTDGDKRQKEWKEFYNPYPCNALFTYRRRPQKRSAPTPGFQSAVTCDASNARLQSKGCLHESNQRLLARQSDTRFHTMIYPSDFKLLTRPPRPCQRTSATRPDLRYDLWLLPDG